MISEQDVIAILIGINSVVFVVFTMRIFKYFTTFDEYMRRLEKD